MQIKEPEYSDPYNDGGGRHIRKTTEMKLSNADQLFEAKSPYQGSHKLNVGNILINQSPIKNAA